MPWAAAAVAGSSALSAGASLAGSGKAASASKQASQMQAEEYLSTQNQLQPFHDIAVNQALPALYNLAASGPTAGGPDYVSQAASYLPGALGDVNLATGFLQNAAALGQGGAAGMAALEQTPGYQFALDQGLKATQSGAAARGLGVSGASMKGAAGYAQGLASQTYQQQFQNQLSLATGAQNLGTQMLNLSGSALNLNTGQQGQIQNQAGRLQAIAALGESAAAQTGSIGATLAGNAGNYLQQAGLAQAAGTTGVANAVTGGVNNYLGYNALQSYLGANQGTGGYQGSGTGTAYDTTPIY